MRKINFYFLFSSGFYDDHLFTRHHKESNSSKNFVSLLLACLLTVDYFSILWVRSQDTFAQQTAQVYFLISTLRSAGILILSVVLYFLIGRPAISSMAEPSVMVLPVGTVLFNTLYFSDIVFLSNKLIFIIKWRKKTSASLLILILVAALQTLAFDFLIKSRYSMQSSTRELDKRGRAGNIKEWFKNRNNNRKFQLE
jgi:hypothetical protein